MRSPWQTTISFSPLIGRLLPSLCLAALCAAQSHPTIPAADRKLIAVTATGSRRFTSAEIAAASGLSLGTVADDQDFRKASRQLGQSGAFGDIAFNYSYSSAGTRLAFQVTDAENFVPAHFADFVWFSEGELSRRIHQRVPLFSGELPATGRLPDQVSDVLQALLLEAAIPGHVDYLRTEDKAGHLASFDYSVANVSIRIDHVHFTGAAQPQLGPLQAAASSLASREYSHALLNNFIARTVLPLYRQRGYLKVSCSAPQPQVVTPPSQTTTATDDPNDEHRPITHVDLTFAITPGIQFKLQRWSWSGNQNIPPETLQPLIHAKPGDNANTVQLEDDLRDVQQLYGSRGYVTAAIKANAEYDDLAQTVSYQLEVNEGPVFHMGELSFRGIDFGLENRLRAVWRLRAGDVYDASYLKQFLPTARKLLPPTIDWEVIPHVTAMAKDKTVDVDLQYTAKAPD